MGWDVSAPCPAPAAAPCCGDACPQGCSSPVRLVPQGCSAAATALGATKGPWKGQWWLPRALPGHIAAVHQVSRAEAPAWAPGSMEMAERGCTRERQRIPPGRGESLLAPVLWLQAIVRVVEPGVQLLFHEVVHHGRAQQVLQERLHAGGKDDVYGVALVSNAVENPRAPAGAEEDLGEEVSTSC